MTEETPAVREIPATELKAMIDRGERFELVDVRSPAERGVARIAGSRLLDQEAYDAMIRMDRGTPLVFYCHHGHRSRAAAAHFRELGFTNLSNVRDGIDGWSRTVDPSVPTY
jgi:monothiol glutaredoxin